MKAAVAAGACIINDVYALRAPGAREVAAETQAGVCLMHMQGEPRTMQHHPQYQDVVAEVSQFLVLARESCMSAGVARDAIVLRYHQDLSYDEAAVIAGDHAGTLQQRVARALPALRRCVDARLYAGGAR